MIHIDNLILKTIEKEFKTVREISKELDLPYVRTSVRIKNLRKVGWVTAVQTKQDGIKGVKPLKYKVKKET